MTGKEVDEFKIFHFEMLEIFVIFNFYAFDHVNLAFLMNLVDATRTIIALVLLYFD
ncbi:hypothetical protein VN0902_04840 [Helicobacter pylori]